MHHVQRSCAFDFWVTGRSNCWWSVVPQEPRCRHDTWSTAPAAWCLECFFRPWSQLLNPCLNFFFFFYFTQTDTLQATSILIDSPLRSLFAFFKMWLPIEHTPFFSTHLGGTHPHPHPQPMATWVTNCWVRTLQLTGSPWRLSTLLNCLWISLIGSSPN